MRSRTSDWFETKVRYDKTQEDGTQKRVTEIYIVDALSDTEAEQTIKTSRKRRKSCLLSTTLLILSTTDITAHKPC